MKTFAIVEDTVVVNCIVADSLEKANTLIAAGQTCVEYVIPDIGDTYVNETIIKEIKPFEVSWVME